MIKLLSDTLRFFATWLQQPTIIEVAASIEVNQEPNK